jgi:serine/threonine-protein kinase
LPDGLAGCFASDRGRPARERRAAIEPTLPEDLFGIAAARSGRPSASDATLVVDPSQQRASDLVRALTAGAAGSTLAVGTMIDKYRIDGVLGSGGFATVYRAKHMLLQIDVAVKLLKESVLAHNPQLVQMLCEEARFAAQISHPNVVRVTDITSNERMTYIVMEYIEGVTLSEAMEARPIGTREAVSIALDVCAGLAAGLAKGLIHRDIKPGNIMIGKDGKVRILDFGLATMESPGDRPGPSAKSSALVGTPAYMAPEQALRPDQADFRADIYSLGISLYHLTTGELPFKAKDPMSLIKMHIEQPPPPPTAHGYPKALAKVVMRMIEKDPELRPLSYDELVAELQQVLDDLSTGATKSSLDILGQFKSLFKK